MFLLQCIILIGAQILISSSMVHNTETMRPKMRVLFLHGKFQSGTIFSNKISGARRKLARIYDLHFIDGPIELDDEKVVEKNGENNVYGWWTRNDENNNIGVPEAFKHVQDEVRGKKYVAIVGFSQGGTLATSLALSGIMPELRAVVTAGAPIVDSAFEVAQQIATDEAAIKHGLSIPKLHFAGENDKLVPVQSVWEMAERGGNALFVRHEQGHLFPTRAAPVNQIIEFLAEALKD
mmetsp:Transcript_10/g.10  ORF Transcript_10/g.10 Transcript_10/m.10 type:complete len:236 (-) Transcript_10:12-719(-)